MARGGGGGGGGDEAQVLPLGEEDAGIG